MAQNNSGRRFRINGIFHKESMSVFALDCSPRSPSWPLTASSHWQPAHSWCHTSKGKWGLPSPCWMMPCSCNARHSSSPLRRLSASPFWRSQSINWQPGKERWYATPCSSLSCRMELLSPMRLKTHEPRKHTSDASWHANYKLLEEAFQHTKSSDRSLLCCCVWKFNPSLLIIVVCVCDHDYDWQYASRSAVPAQTRENQHITNSSSYCSYNRCPRMKIFTSVLKGNVPSSLRKRYSSLASLNTGLLSQTEKRQHTVSNKFWR